MQNILRSFVLSCASWTLPVFGAAVVENSPQNLDETPEFRVYFSKGDRLDSKSQEFLQNLSKFAIQHKAAIKDVSIAGHASRTGKEGVNRRISLKRAEKASSYFKDIGLASENLQIIAFGSSRPIPDLPTSHREHRRATISFVLRGDNGQALKELQQLSRSHMDFVSVEDKGMRRKENILVSSVNWEQARGNAQLKSHLSLQQQFAFEDLVKIISKDAKSGGQVFLTMPLSAVRNQRDRAAFLRLEKSIRRSGVSRSKIMTRFDSRVESVEVGMTSLQRNTQLLASFREIIANTKNMAAVRMKDRKSVALLAPYLAKNGHSWEQINIVSSNKNSESIRRELIRQGVPRERIKMRHGDSRNGVIVSVSGSHNPSELQRIMDDASHDSQLAH